MYTVHRLRDWLGWDGARRGSVTNKDYARKIMHAIDFLCAAQ